MPEDPRAVAARSVLAEKGASAPETDLDTLAGQIVKAIDDADANTPADQQSGAGTPSGDQQPGEGGQPAGAPADNPPQS